MAKFDPAQPKAPKHPTGCADVSGNTAHRLCDVIRK